MLIPVIVGLGLAGGAAYYLKRRDEKVAGELSDAAKKVYDTAMEKLKDPAKLSKLAQVFRAQGHPVEAKMLEARAALRGAPAEVKKARREAFKKGMASTNVLGIRNLATEFEKIGATGAAATLNRKADSIEGAV